MMEKWKHLTHEQGQA